MATIPGKDGGALAARREANGAMRLRPGRRRLLYAVAAALWASGALWLVAHYFWAGQSEYGPATSPAEPWALRLHGLFAMAALAFLGLLWAVHVVRGWTAGRRRWSGGLLFALSLVLVLTGYLLYYVGDDDLRGWASLAHWSLGLAALPAFLLHRFLPKR